MFLHGTIVHDGLNIREETSVHSLSHIFAIPLFKISSPKSKILSLKLVRNSG